MGITWSSPSKPRHLVVIPFESWGHMRPLCNFVARIVQMEPALIVTYFTTATFYDRVQTEVKRNFEVQETTAQRRIRIIALPHDAMDLISNTVFLDAFANAYQKLVNLQCIKCSKTGEEFGTSVSPDVVFVDFFGSAPIDAVRKASREQAKVFFWFAGSAISLFCISGPEKMGGRGDLRARSEEYAKLAGVSIEQAAGEICLSGKGALVHMPGLPPMYDYEIHPQRSLGTMTSMGSINLSAYDTIAASDGIVLATPECYEPEAVAVLRDWLAESSKSLYVCGPLIPRSSRAAVFEKQQGPETDKVESFLNAKMASHGGQSVLYISFGTIFFPVEPLKLSAFLDIAIEKRLPFILNHASPFIPLPDSVTKKLSSYADCLVTKWCPQQLVLKHRATSYFVTHAGHNSVVESLIEGVPLICWPFTLDQATNAARISGKLQVGYELFEIRNGPGLQPAYRLGKAPEGTMEAFASEAREVLAKAFGEDGKIKHANVLRLKRQIDRAWDENGSSRKAVEDFLSSFGATGHPQKTLSALSAWI